MEPYVYEAENVVRGQHLLPLRNVAGGSNEAGEMPPEEDFGSKPDPGTLSFFNQWCQQKKKNIRWVEKGEQINSATPIWEMTVFVDEVKRGGGRATNKKSAKVLAAKQAMEQMDIKIGKGFIYV